MKRILYCGESSLLSTGYATYALEVLRRLAATGKYDLMEMASYGQAGDPRFAELPWKVFPVAPAPGDEAAHQAYRASPLNQFGAALFEEALLRHRPHICFSIRDVWMDEHIAMSPLRGCYHFAYMPTVDARPQMDHWLEVISRADAVFTYSDWALEELRRQGGGRLNLRCSAPAGADFETLQPVPDRRAHRRALGLDEDALIIGTVMRNQRRKLYPDLMLAFSRFLAEAPPEMARRSYLYLHTAYPDLGWDIPALLREYGIGHRTLFSYLCRECGAYFPAYYQDTCTVCRRCGKMTAGFPNTRVGVPRATLAAVYNLFDLFAQYSNSEGQGMPQVEAAACGVPVLSTDYSAMSDVVRKLQGTPLRVLYQVREPETGCLRAIPDPEDFVTQAVRLLSLPQCVRSGLGQRARAAAQTHYSWDSTAKRWEEHFDGVEAPPDEQTWGAPARLHEPQRQIPDGLSHADFVRWGMVKVAGRPDLAHSLQALRLTRDLTWGVTQATSAPYFNDQSALGSQERLQPFGREQAMELFLGLCEKRNHWEARRASGGKRARS